MSEIMRLNEFGPITASRGLLEGVSSPGDAMTAGDGQAYDAFAAGRAKPYAKAVEEVKAVYRKLLPEIIDRDELTIDQKLKAVRTQLETLESTLDSLRKSEAQVATAGKVKEQTVESQHDKMLRGLIGAQALLERRGDRC